MDNDKEDSSNITGTLGDSKIAENMEEKQSVATDVKETSTSNSSSAITSDKTEKELSVEKKTNDDSDISGDKEEKKIVGGGFKMPIMIAPKFKPKKLKDLTDEKDKKPEITTTEDPKKDADEEESETVETKNKQSLHSKSKYLSPAEQLKYSQASPSPYKEPSWSGIPDGQYNFEILKNGLIVDNIDLTKKAYHVLGRLPSCDVTLEHPSLSRYHSVVQYRQTPSEKQEVGWYLYDLDSTHGTWVNKIKIKPLTYYRLRVGHVVKFGGSTRLFILQVLTFILITSIKCFL